MNIRLVCLGAVCFLCAGCANLAREAQRSDGFLDFVVAIAGRPRKDVVPVKRVSEQAGEILTAHAEVDHRGGTYVSGMLRSGFGYEGVFDAHVDVKVFGPDRLLITTLVTDYSPRPIPNDYHGTPGRAWFSVRLPFVPTPGSSIVVSFHRSVQQELEFTRSDSYKQPLAK